MKRIVSTRVWQRSSSISFITHDSKHFSRKQLLNFVTSSSSWSTPPEWLHNITEHTRSIFSYMLSISFPFSIGLFFIATRKFKIQLK